MPILSQNIVTQAASALDAEGSDRYLFEQDYKPAINYAIDMVVMAVNSVFSDKKYAGETLRELLKVGIWQTNKYSRVSINPADIGAELWTIVAVYPRPIIDPNQSQPALKDPVRSEFYPDKAFVESVFSCDRKTSQEWNDNNLNPFASGNNIITNDDLISYAYRDFTDYSSTKYTNPVNAEIEIRPSIAKQFVAIEFLRRPTYISNINDNVQLPSAMINFMVDKVLNFISFKQGDNTTLYAVSREDINAVSRLIS